MKKDLLIFGAGGFAAEVLWTIEDINRDKSEWNVLGFLDDNAENWGKELNGLPVLDPAQFETGSRNKYSLAFGIGGCITKYNIAKRFARSNCDFPAFIHPSVVFSRHSSFGVGFIAQAGVIVTPNVTIHNFVTLNLAVTLAHDVVIEDYATLAPGVHLSGWTHIGKASDIGIGAVSIQHTKIGRECVIGANVIVTKTVPDYSIVVGIPSKVGKDYYEPQMEED